MGDFNLPHIDWETSTFKNGGYYPVISKLMIDIMNDYNLEQIVKEPTRGENILDLCFTTHPASVQSVQVTHGISDHDLVIIEAILKPKINRPPKRKIYLYKKANYEGINKDMIEFNKSLSLDRVDSSSIDELYTSFKETLHSSVDCNIPSKQSSSHLSYPWVDRSIKRDIKRKQRLYNKAKKSGLPSHRADFKKLRRNVDRRIRKAFKTYLRDVVGASLKSDNPKPFWSFIKAKKQEVSGVPPLKVLGNTLTSAKDKAEVLNQYFCSVYTHEDPNIPDLGPSNTPDIDDITITEEGIKKLLESLNPNKAPGPDDISGMVLKNCSGSIAPILKKLFQKSISTGTLPMEWLKANITPIYKKDDRTQPNNYRPVSLTSVICKLLEHIIHGHIMKHFEKHNILADQQHGFRKGRSCETQLSALVDDIQKILDNRSQVDLIITDFRKAFDVVPHQRLLAKLHHVGIRNSIYSWLTNFLTKRQQKVVLEGESSEEARVRSGVPQGTVLGPLLFLVYINDLPTNLTSSVRLFADDCMLYREIHNTEDSALLQEDVNTLCTWESRWQMGFNVSKCHIMTVTHKTKPLQHDYTMGEKVLGRVTHHPYLGVEISSDMSWNTHINQTVKKANKQLGLIRRNLYSCDKSTKSVAYHTLVRPILEYCHAVWDPHQQTNKDLIEKIQRRAARFAMNDYNQTSSVTNMLKQLGWESLDARRCKARLHIVFKETHGLVPSNISTYRLDDGNHPAAYRRPTTRQSSKSFIYEHIRANKKCYQQSLYPRTIPTWNKLPDDYRCAPTLQKFKNLLENTNIEAM